MQAGEALALLSRGLPEDQVGACARDLAGLATRLREWAQLLKLANGFLRERVLKFHQPLARAIAEAGQRLTARGLPAFDDPKARDYEGRHRSVAAAIGVNLDLLDAEGRARFSELSIFPEDVDVPVGIVARLWHATGGLDAFATVDLLSELSHLSLLLDLDLDRRVLRVHDTTHQFLQDEARKAGQLVAQHARLAAAIAGIDDANDAEAAETVYFYRYLPEHLHEAGDRAALDAKLNDPRWLQAKLDVTAAPLALASDYEKFGHGRMQSLIGRTLRLTASICARDPRQLMPQLLGRLMSVADPAASGFLAAVRRHVDPQAILTQHPSLTPPGAEITRLEVHAAVSALAALPDGRLASSSLDRTIRLWDLTRVVETTRLEVDGGGALALAPAALPDGRLAFSGYDVTIRLWDPAQGAETALLEGHWLPIVALAVLSDGRLASGGDDGTVRLWDPTRGTETARLEVSIGSVSRLVALPQGCLAFNVGNIIRLWDPTCDAKTAYLSGHSYRVDALTVLPSGCLASCSRDGTIRVWDPARGTETARLEVPGCSASRLAALPDGRLAFNDVSGAIRLWDPARGAEIARLEGHDGWVLALAVLPGGRLASGGGDGTIRLWDPAAETTRLEGHGSRVLALTVLRDGRLASSGFDRTIRLWDPERGAETARWEIHSGWEARSLTVLPDGRLVSSELTIRLWDPARGTEIARLERHRDSTSTNTLAVLPDGRLASGGDDFSIRLWDLTRGAENARLEGHAGPVKALTMLPDGHLASGGADGTIRLWDPQRAAETARLEGGIWVEALVTLPDGRLAFSGRDGTIRLWDPAQGTETARLEGHHGWVRAMAVLPNGRLTSGGDDRTVRLWDIARGVETARLEVDGAVTCLIALPDGRLVAGDVVGRLHWLVIVE
jgi:WD40 repeat protein